VSAKKNNVKTLSLFLLCWAALLVMTFKARFYEFYLPNENLTFGDFKYVLSCGNFEVNDVNCNEYMYGRWLLVFLSKVTFLHPYPEQTTFVIIAVSLLAIAHLLLSLKNKIQKNDLCILQNYHQKIYRSLINMVKAMIYAHGI
jgi:hypothetical protein